MSIGEKLKQLREYLELTGKELSQISGVTPSLISELESGKRQSTSTDTIAKLAQALRVSPAYFFDTPYQKAVYSIPPEYHPFLVSEDNRPYLELARKTYESGLPPEIINELIDLAIRISKPSTVSRSKTTYKK